MEEPKACAGGGRVEALTGNDDLIIPHSKCQVEMVRVTRGTFYYLGVSLGLPTSSSRSRED